MFTYQITSLEQDSSNSMRKFLIFISTMKVPRIFERETIGKSFDKKF